MKVHLVFPAFPPAFDGIGDHTARLAAALAPRCTVKVLTAQPDPVAPVGVPVVRAFRSTPRAGVRDLLDAVEQDRPDWLVVQYNPFSYGRWGINPYLPSVVRGLGRRYPGLRLGLVVHEAFVPPSTLKFALMAPWQRLQLRALGRSCDLICCATEAWQASLRGWFPGKPVVHIPVGSNIPHIDASRDAVRADLGVGDDVLVVGLFGSAHPSRLLSFVRDALERLQRERSPVVLVYVGSAGERVRRVLAPLPVQVAGRLPPEAVSRVFAAMDLYLAPFRKGVSTRRGSFMAGLQHGVPTVSTRGIHTDDVLRRHDGRAFVLAPDDDGGRYADLVLTLANDPLRQRRLGEEGRVLFEAEFSWSRIAGQLLVHLQPSS